MKILFPTDLSDESLASIKSFLPTFIKDDKNVEVQFLHVVERPVQGATLMVDITKILKGDAEDQLREEKRSIKEQFGIDIEPKVEVGYYSTELKDFVSLEKPDMVVLVSKARHGIMKYLSGQQSLKFIGEIDAPLLIIPEDSKFKRIAKLGFAVDKGDSPTVDTMNKIKAVSAYFGAEVELVHISNKEEENKDFYERLSDSTEFGEVSLVEKKNIREGIQLWCLQNEIDILVTVTHDRSAFSRTFSGSVTRDLVQDNLIALLIINQ